MVCCNRQFKYYYNESLKGLILGVALCGATFSMHARQSEVFVPRTNVKLSALIAISIVLGRYLCGV